MIRTSLVSKAMSETMKRKYTSLFSDSKTKDCDKKHKKIWNEMKDGRSRSGGTHQEPKLQTWNTKPRQSFHLVLWMIHAHKDVRKSPYLSINKTLLFCSGYEFVWSLPLCTSMCINVCRDKRKNGAVCSNRLHLIYHLSSQPLFSLY